MGYAQVGFEVVGVDILPMPHYPFAFVQMDALEALRTLIAGGCITDNNGEDWYLGDFDAIHASPPCQGYSRLRHLPWMKDRSWPMLIEPTRELLVKTGKPWVIENVMDAPLQGIYLCGLMFDLPLYRHRRFESSFPIAQPEHTMHQIALYRSLSPEERKNSGKIGKKRKTFEKVKIVHVVGRQFGVKEGGRAMEIDWMDREELAEAIPPAYTRYVGRQLIAYLEQKG
jgi:DNA (cytosine-5)-methyltransferase 1